VPSFSSAALSESFVRPNKTSLASEDIEGTEGGRHPSPPNDASASFWFSNEVFVPGSDPPASFAEKSFSLCRSGPFEASVTEAASHGFRLGST
jgi:hypothetical protein